MEQDSRFTADFAHKVAPYFFAKNTMEEKPELVNNFIQSLIDVPYQHMAGKIALGRAIFTRNDLMDQLKQIKIPTLIVVGEEDGPRPPHEAQEMAHSIPNAEIAIIPRAGHICTLEQPDAVNQVLTHFLNNHI